MIQSIESDSDGLITSINIKKDIPDRVKPLITVKDGSVLFKNSSGEYVAFDPDLVNNVYTKVYLDKISTENNDTNLACSSSYCISIEPIDCSVPMQLNNIKLYTPKNQWISDISNNGNHITLNGELSDQLSCIINSQLRNFWSYTPQPSNPSCQANANSLYYIINGLDGKLITKVLAQPNGNGSIDTLEISNSADISDKPLLTIMGGTIQYLDADGVYQNFDSSLYQNVDANMYDLRDLFGALVTSAYALRVSQKDIRQPMIFSDITLYPFQNYSLTNVKDDGTIEYNQILNNLTSFL